MVEMGGMPQLSDVVQCMHALFTTSTLQQHEAVALHTFIRGIPQGVPESFIWWQGLIVSIPVPPGLHCCLARTHLLLLRIARVHPENDAWMLLFGLTSTRVCNVLCLHVQTCG